VEEVFMLTSNLRLMILLIIRIMTDYLVILVCVIILERLIQVNLSVQLKPTAVWLSREESAFMSGLKGKVLE